MDSRECGDANYHSVMFSCESKRPLPRDWVLDIGVLDDEDAARAARSLLGVLESESRLGVRLSLPRLGVRLSLPRLGVRLSLIHI